ncbi:MAG: ABC transporter permease subunit [Thermoplasmata archaeon]
MRKNLIGLFALVKYSTKKILFSKRIIIAVLITIFIAGVMGYVSSQNVSRLDGGANLFDMLILFFFLPVISMIYGSSLIRDEIEDRSITQVLVSPLDRSIAYLGYYLALVISLSLIIVWILFTGFVVYFGNLYIDSDAVGIFLNILYLNIIGVFAYSSLFLLVSVITDKSIYFGLFYAFIWEGFIGSLPGNIRKIAIKHYIRSIGSEWMSYGSIVDYDATNLSGSILVLFWFTVFMLFTGALLFRYKEFP